MECEADTVILEFGQLCSSTLAPCIERLQGDASIESERDRGEEAQAMS